MANGMVLFETKVSPKEGVPYLATKNKVRLLITTSEFYIVDPKWTLTIPFNRTYSCTARPLLEKRTVYTTFPFSTPSTLEVMNNYLLIDYLNELNQRVLFRAAFSKYFWIKSNVVEAIRFDEVIKAYHLDDKFIKTPPSSDVKSND